MNTPVFYEHLKNVIAVIRATEITDVAQITVQCRFPQAWQKAMIVAKDLFEFDLTLI